MADEATTPESATPAAPAQPSAARSTIAGGGIDIDAARGAIAVGAMTHEEAARHWNLTPDEAKGLGTPAPARKPSTVATKGAETQLNEIRAARRADPKSYTPEVEKRELGLIKHVQDRATVSASGTIIAAAQEPLRKVDAELAEIKKARGADLNAYRKDQAMQNRELELLRQREELTGEVATLENINLIASSVYDTTPDQAAFDGAFDAVYDSISAESQASMRAELGSATPMEPSRPASEAQVQAFSAEPIGAELVSEWGRHAPKKVAMVQARVARMLPNANDRAAMEDWFDALPPETAKAVIRSIAR